MRLAFDLEMRKTRPSSVLKYAHLYILFAVRRPLTLMARRAPRALNAGASAKKSSPKSSKQR